MRLLSYFLCTSSVSVLVIPTTTARKFPFPLGASEKKQTTYKVLMGLIVLMLVLQTIHIACTWYTAWLGFIHYSNAPDQALEALEVDDLTSFSLQIIRSMEDLLITMRLAIADSIMASTHPSFSVKLLIAFDFKVWRCWIICDRNRRIAIIPLISNLGSIGM